MTATIRRFALASLALLAAMPLVQACPPRSEYSPGCCQAPSRPAPRQSFIVCTQDASGNWWVRKLLPSAEAAQQLADALKLAGQKAWAMKAEGVPSGFSISLSNGEVAIAIAVSLGQDAHAVAIGPSGRAEAIARPGS